MAHIGKRVRAGREGIDRTKLYPLQDAIKKLGKPAATTRRKAA